MYADRLSPKLRLAVPLTTAALLLGSFVGLLAAGELSSPSTAAAEISSPRLAAVAVIAHDLDEMLGFYRDTLGFVVERHDTGEFVELRNEGVRFQLLAPDSMKYASGYDGFDAPRSGHSFELAFEVATPEQVDAMFARIVAAGARAISPPADKPWGQRMAFFADPDGNIHDVYANL